jgi:hypothetical protein
VVTVIAELPVLPAVVARILTVPAATAMTRPVLVTVAIEGFVVDQVKTVPDVAGLVDAVS